MLKTSPEACLCYGQPAPCCRVAASVPSRSHGKPSRADRARHFNEESGFAVWKVKAKGHRDHVTMVGSLPSVSAGEWLTAEGRWVQDREFGQQFRAEMLNSTAPTAREGIEK
jgi:exodeoxyribonuclease V alpha subunit